MDVIHYCPGQGNGWDNLHSNNRGFSLIEVLISLVVITILAFSAFPNFSALLARERTTVLSNTLAGALAYARSESITRQFNVVTCQSNDGNECNRTENWHNGWIIFTDKNNNRHRDADDTLLRVYPATKNGTQLTFHGSGRGTHFYMRYKPTGEAYPNGSFLICHPDSGVGNALIMTLSGRLRFSKKQTNGLAITCN